MSTCGCELMDGGGCDGGWGGTGEVAWGGVGRGGVGKLPQTKHKLMSSHLTTRITRNIPLHPAIL